MKLFRSILLAVAAAAAVARGGLATAQTTVNFYLTQFTGNTNDTTINLQSKNNPVIYSGNFYWFPAGGTNLTTTNGFASVNLIPGQYTATLAGIPQAWTLTVTNSAIALNAAALTTGTTIFNGINRLSGTGVTNDGHGNYVANLDGIAITNLIETNAPVGVTAYDLVTNQTLILFTNYNQGNFNAQFNSLQIGGDGVQIGQGGLAGYYQLSDIAGNTNYTWPDGWHWIGKLWGNGGGVTNVQATNLVGTEPLSVLNPAVVTNGAGFNAIGASNLPAYRALSGQLQLQPGMTVLIQTNLGSSPWNNNTNFFCIAFTNGNQASQQPWTNNPCVAIYRGYPVNVLAFGYLPGLTGLSLPGQSAEIRVRTTIYGNQFELLTDGATMAYRSDNSAWTYDYAAGGQALYWTFLWPNFGFHTLELDEADGGMPLVAMYCPATNAFVNTPQPTQTGIIIGDSITDGAVIPLGEDLWPAQLEDLLETYGINLIPMGEGGTGYTTGGSSGGTNFLSRLTNNLVSLAPQFILWAGGINDQSTSNLLYAAETNCYGKCKTLLPNCKQLVVAPFGDQSPALGNSVGIDQITSNAAAAYGLPVIYPQFTTNAGWMTGFYNVPGSGNAPLFETGSGPHPTAQGHQFIAHMLANFVLTNLLTNATPQP